MCALPPLHSSMDRFEVKKLDILEVNHLSLHSSMDRFEAKAHLPTTQTLQTLHSSMDRFEEIGNEK